ncbi:hypothetical protein DY000_02062054 [Brassica cretica]|uniref:Btz domain-containing protein n=1 Tax=Brassica cretica TaxID=69181 RepID=A0ABQ7ANY0_BRACR|nr:hypothetical protein DY000_02062054 [Brassica cretica]
MAPDGVEEADYESDPEELKRSLAARRREASDDEDENQPKQKEPFAVPTAGAFYMHDDRFQEMDTAPNRRMRGGRRLWPSRDERKWGHDKYDEMNTQEKQYDKRTSRGRARGRGQEHGYSRGHQNQYPKAVTRGRGPRRNEVALRKGTQAPSVQTKQSQNSFVKVSHVDPGGAPTETDSIETEARINVVASSLNSASPPFYPSGSSSNLAQKDLQAGMGRLHVNGSPTPSGKKFGNAKPSTAWVRTTPPQTTSQGRGAPPPGKVLNQGDNVSSPMQIRGMPKESATETGALLAQGKGALQPNGRGSFMYGGTQFMGPDGGMAAGHGNPNFHAFLPVMQFGGQHGGVPTFGMALPGYVQPEHGTGNPEMTWLPILTGPGALGASYPPPYAAIEGSYQAHKPGLPSSAGSSSCLRSVPAVCTVMQFGGQHGGVPTFGMALPGYVQPEHGTGNPEMTWLPILTGPGALGASYPPPYAAIEGSYQAHKPGLPSSAGSSSQENSSNNPIVEEKPLERPDAKNNGTPQRSNSNPNKQPRRYSEMSLSK